MPKNLDTFAPRWWTVEDARQIEAVTIEVSETVYITGFGVGRDVMGDTKICYAWVTESVKTGGDLLWEHTANHTIPYSPADYDAKLSVVPPIALQPNKPYTLVVQYQHGARLFNGRSEATTPKKCCGKDGVVFSFTEPEFEQGERRLGFAARLVRFSVSTTKQQPLQANNVNTVKCEVSCIGIPHV
jgi:hypothetical protein